MDIVLSVLAIAVEAAHDADWPLDEEFGLDPADVAEADLDVRWAAYRSVSGRTISGVRSATFTGELVEALT